LPKLRTLRAAGDWKSQAVVYAGLAVAAIFAVAIVGALLWRPGARIYQSQPTVATLNTQPQTPLGPPISTGIVVKNGSSFNLGKGGKVNINGMSRGLVVDNSSAINSDGTINVTRTSTPVVGNDNTLLNVPNARVIGNGNTIIGQIDSRGNAIINTGGTAIGNGATADSTSIATGAGARAGNNSVNVQPGAVASFGQQGGQTAATIINNGPRTPTISEQQSEAIAKMAGSFKGTVQIEIDQPSSAATEQLGLMTAKTLGTRAMVSRSTFIGGCRVSPEGLAFMVGTNRAVEMILFINALVGAEVVRKDFLQTETPFCTRTGEPDEFVITIRRP
jgi:hypothetical protein